MKLILSSFLAGLVAGAVAIWYFYPAPEQQTRTITQNDVRTITRTVYKVDGSKTVYQETIDRSKQQTESKKTAKPKYVLGITAGNRLEKLNQPIYGLQGSVRVLGPVFAGAYGRTDGEFGALVQLQF